jgi:hypothetical protein
VDKKLAAHVLISQEAVPMLRNHPSAVRPVSRVAAFLFVLGLAALPGGVVTAQDSVCEPVVPCADSRGCPDLLIDPGVLGDLSHFNLETRTFAPDDCVVLEGMVEAGTRRLLTFSTMTVNFGAGDLFLGNPQDNPEWYDLENCHDHAHIKEYADDRLWIPTGYEM